MSSESLLSVHEDQDLFSGLRRNMEARLEHQKAKQYRVLYTIASCVGAVLVSLVLYWVLSFRGGFTWSTNPELEFNWHPFFMVTGLIFVYAQSMLIYRSARSYPKINLKIAHTCLHLLAFIMSVIGLKAVFDSHNLAKVPIPNLYTLHSWVGLITVILFACQFAVGFISFLIPGLPTTWRAAILPVHKAIGIGTFISAVTAALMGLTEKALWALGKEYTKSGEGTLINFIGVFILFFGVLVLYLVNEHDYKRTGVTSDEMALTDNE